MRAAASVCSDGSDDGDPGSSPWLITERHVIAGRLWQISTGWYNCLSRQECEGKHGLCAHDCGLIRGCRKQGGLLGKRRKSKKGRRLRSGQDLGQRGGLLKKLHEVFDQKPANIFFCTILWKMLVLLFVILLLLFVIILSRHLDPCMTLKH